MNVSAGISPPGYRLPETTRLGAVTLLVRDLERSLKYYQQLGLALLTREGEVASMAPPGSAVPLVHLHGGATAPMARRSQRLGLYHFAILVPDRAALGRCLKHLGASGVAVASADHAVSEALYLWDPDGLGIEIYVDRPRAAWQVRGRELFMTSEPLDLRGLGDVAGEEAWRGFPADTVLGHMHLHVGDLGQAEAFYHSALGFDKMVWSYPGALFLAAGGYHHHLGTNTWAGAAPPRGATEAGLLEWELLLPTREAAQAAVESCVRSGHPVTAGERGWVVSDPWTTRLRVRWRHDGV